MGARRVTLPFDARLAGPSHKAAHFGRNSRSRPFRCGSLTRSLWRFNLAVSEGIARNHVANQLNDLELTANPA